MRLWQLLRRVRPFWLRRVLRWVLRQLSRLWQWLLRIWFEFWWEATPGVVFFCYALTVVPISLWVAVKVDALPYLPWVQEQVVNRLNLTSHQAVTAIFDWLLRALPIAVTVFSFSYSLVKDVSLSFMFGKSPKGRHLIGLFVVNLYLGLFDIVVNSIKDPGHDWFMVGLLYVFSFVLLIAQGTVYVREQFRKISLTDEFAYCLERIIWFSESGIGKAATMAGTSGVEKALEQVRANIETMFQVLGILVQREMDGDYPRQIAQASRATSSLLLSLNGRRLSFETYADNARHLVDKHFDHLLVVSSRFHGKETRVVLDAGFGLLDQVANYNRSALVLCVEPIRTAVLSLFHRRDRGTLMAVLEKLNELYERAGSEELGAALLFLYQSLLGEAIGSNDRMILHELLHMVRHLQLNMKEKYAPDLVPSLHRMLWVALLKSIEHSSRSSTTAFLQTFVARFDQQTAAKALDIILLEYEASSRKQLYPIGAIGLSDLVTKVNSLRTGAIVDCVARQLEKLNPQIGFIQDGLRYCLEKMVVLWYGQQRHMFLNGADRSSDLFQLPDHIAILEGANFKYFLSKLVEDDYKLSWIQGPELGATIEEIQRAREVPPSQMSSHLAQVAAALQGKPSANPPHLGS